MVEGKRVGWWREEGGGDSGEKKRVMVEGKKRVGLWRDGMVEGKKRVGSGRKDMQCEREGEREKRKGMR